jgi:signal transduction histidine kinase
MRLPLSVHARIGLLAIAMIATVLLVGVTEIDAVIEGVVADNVDVKMDTQVRILARAVDRQGRLDTPALEPYAELAEPAAGWGWNVVTPVGQWARGLQPGEVEYPVPRIHPIDGIYSGRGHSTAGVPVRVRRIDPQPGSLPITVKVVSPRDLIDREIARVQAELRLVFAEVALVVALASFLQLRFGLQPLRRLGQQIARVRTGDLPRLAERQPPELQPVAQEINALVQRNDAALETARMNAANLAHSLKTPLASLLLELEHEGASEHSRHLVEQISERVAHHLSRARSGAIGLGSRARCEAAGIVAELVGLFAMAPRRRAIVIENALEPPCLVAVDRHDLAEMLGSLIENACRHAAGRVVVSASFADQTVCLAVEDDGPGIPAERLGDVVRAGVRLDEAGEGYGLGLTIVQEMSSLYGGRLELGPGPLGGLRAVLILPREATLV